MLQALLPFALLLGLLGNAARPQGGHFALQSGEALTKSYLRATAASPDALTQRLDVWFTRGPVQTLRRYDVDMTKYLHLVAVSDDFSVFLHLHPQLFADGHFRLSQRFPKAATYHIYADGEPHGVGQQVFRFDVVVGAPAIVRRRRLPPVTTSVRTGPYVVSLDTTHVRTGAESAIRVHVREGGSPAALQPYLGASAHAVFLDARDLTYVHVHPMAQGASHAPSAAGMEGMMMSMSVSPDMVLHVAVREPGTYALWLEFRAAGALYVAPFVISAASSA